MKKKESNRKSVGEMVKDPKINWYIDFRKRREKKILQKEEKRKGNKGKRKKNPLEQIFPRCKVCYSVHVRITL